MTWLLTPHMLFVLILYMGSGTNSLQLTPNDRFLRCFSWQFYFDTQSFCQKYAETKSPKKYFHTYVLMSDLSFELKLTYYLLDCGLLIWIYNFRKILIIIVGRKYDAHWSSLINISHFEPLFAEIQVTEPKTLTDWSFVSQKIKHLLCWTLIYLIGHYIHTYIIGHYNPSVGIIDLVFHTTYCVCVDFIRKRKDLQFKVDRFFEKLFMGIFYLLLEFLPEICWEEIAEEIFFVFCFDVWRGVRTLALRLISQHTTY